MYNIIYDFQLIQEMYPSYNYQWNYPMVCMPISFYSPDQDITNPSQQQIQKSYTFISPSTRSTGSQQSSNSQSDEEFELENEGYSPEECKKLIQKQKRKYYGTKNTEANIINQTFSFMNCYQKSGKVLEKLLKGDQKKIQVFYIMMKIVKRNLKKYVNRSYLKSIFDMDRKNIIFKLLSKGVKRLEILPIQKFKEIFRKLVFYYFTNQMPTHLLSSNRLSKSKIGEHLKRRREIMSYIFKNSK